MTKIIKKENNEILGTNETKVLIYTKDGCVEYIINTYEFNQFTMTYINTHSFEEINELLIAHGAKRTYDNISLERKEFLMRG